MSVPSAAAAEALVRSAARGDEAAFACLIAEHNAAMARAFNTYDTGNIHSITEPSNIYTIEPDGSHLTQLSTASVGGTMRLGQPFWSPDGTRIWVSVAYDYERDSNDQYKNVLGWVDARTGAFTEIGTEGKRFRERPLP